MAPTANERRVRVLDGRPVDFLDPDRAHMLALPPMPPVTETVTSVRLGRDYYARVAGNDYSVDPSAIGQLVDVTTTPPVVWHPAVVGPILSIAGAVGDVDVARGVHRDTRGSVQAGELDRGVRPGG